MTNSELRSIDKKGYTLHIIDSKKFKTIHLTAKFRTALTRDMITKRALLPFVLQQGSEDYPTANEFRRALDQLYGATYSMDGAKKGEQHVLTARMTLANPTFLATDENILKEGLTFFKQTLLKPKLVNQQFDPKIVKKEKLTLKQKIAAIVDDKMHYANVRLVDEMCQNEPYQVHVHGYEEDLDGINGENLYQYYSSILRNDLLDIYVLGDLSSIDVEELIADMFDREPTNQQKQQHIPKGKTIKETAEVIEEQSVQQAKLHLGFRTHTHFSDSDYPALQVFNGIFGAFPSSKLFLNVREKHSLAYYASSQFESHKGLLFVYSGIAPKDYEQAKTIILEQMEAMTNGDFEEEQIEDAKKQIMNQYKETLDNPFGIIEMIYNQRVAGTSRSAEELLVKINEVDKESIIKMANKIKLDTIYLLTANGGQTDE